MTKKTKESSCRRRLIVAWRDLVCTVWVIHRVDSDAAIRLAYMSRYMSVLDGEGGQRGLLLDSYGSHRGLFY